MIKEIKKINSWSFVNLERIAYLNELVIKNDFDLEYIVTLVSILENSKIYGVVIGMWISELLESRGIEWSSEL